MACMQCINMLFFGFFKDTHLKVHVLYGETEST
jgi:hypothetical protein